MAHELTKISGIGDTAATSLSDAGFTTIDAVAEATPAALGKAHGFGPARAARVIAAAQELIEDGQPVPVIKFKDKPIEIDVKKDEEIMTDKTEETVEPVIAAEATKRFAALRKPQSMAIAAAVVVAGVAAANAETVTGFFDFLRTAVPPIAAKTDDAVKPQAVVAKAVQAPVVVKKAAPAARTATRKLVAPAPVPYGARPFYPVYAPWNNTPWNNGYFGNGTGNGEGNFSMNLSAKTQTAANGNVYGNGYGYQRPMYAPAYGYAPYAYPHPSAYRPVAKPATKK